MNKKTWIAALFAAAIVLTSFNGVITAQAVTKSYADRRIPAHQMVKSIKKAPVKPPYTLIKTVYKNKNITIHYPAVNGLKDSIKRNMINKIIKQEALSRFKNSIDSKLHTNIDYKISLSNKSILSIQYSGVSNYTGAAHPTNIFYTTNIDLNHAKAMKLSDTVLINNNFVQTFRHGSYTSLANKTNQKLQAQIARYINSLNNTDLITAFKGSDFTDINKNTHATYSCFTKDSMVISINALHALGDHLEYKIAYSTLKNSKNIKNSIWKNI